MKPIPSTVGDYINSRPEEVREILSKIRETIRNAAPDAEEIISYGMPAYKLGGHPLVYFAAFRKHIGFYALPRGHHEFSAELSAYKGGRGSVQFPLNRMIPLDLIRRITEFNVLRLRSEI